MNGVVYLLAGNSHARSGHPDPAMQAFFREVGKPKPRVAYIGTASGDDRAFFEAMRACLQASGAGEVELAPLCGAAKDAVAARCVLSRADAVFVSGGDVAEGMDVLRSLKGMTACLRERFASGVPFMGLSAGSIMLACGWVRWAGEDEAAEQGTLFDCLAFAPVYCDVHGEADGWAELKALLRLLPDQAVGYAIPSGCALRVSEGIVEPAPGACMGTSAVLS
jgi:peptidase E